MSDEQEALRLQLEYARRNLRDIRVRIAQYALREDVPLSLVQNERRLKAEISRLEEAVGQPDHTPDSLPEKPPHRVAWKARDVEVMLGHANDFAKPLNRYLISTVWLGISSALLCALIVGSGVFSTIPNDRSTSVMLDPLNITGILPLLPIAVGALLSLCVSITLFIVAIMAHIRARRFFASVVVVAENELGRGDADVITLKQQIKIFKRWWKTEE